MLLAAITEEPSTSCRTGPRRYLIVPDEVQVQAELIRATSAVGVVREEAGIGIRQPSIDDVAAPAGDLRPALSGTPEVHVEGVLAVAQSGAVEAARFGWLRDGDNLNTDLQLRQSPHVLGRRPDCLRTYQHPAQDRIVRPKLLPLKSGDLLLGWIRSDYGPIYQRDRATWMAIPDNIVVQRLDHLTDQWSTAVYTIPVQDTDTGPYVLVGYCCGFDFIQFPDTGEIVALVLVIEGGTPSTSRRMLTYCSVDDGETWVERRRLQFNGGRPDIILDRTGNWAADHIIDDLSNFQSIAVELLPSGRIVALIKTETDLWSLISDDRGSSFTAVHVAGPNVVTIGSGIGSTLARNSIALFTACPAVVVIADVVVVYMTANGVDWTAADVQEHFQTRDHTVCVSPDGWPHVYGTVHQSWAGPAQPSASLFRDWLWGRRFITRDPQLGDTDPALFPTYSIGGFAPELNYIPAYAFHVPGTTGLGPSGLYSGIPVEQVIYSGFVGIDAVEHRGQVVLAVTVQKDITPVEPVNAMPVQDLSSLMIYRANHWQPLKENLGDARASATGVGVPGNPAGGRIYNRTWDCYDLPRNWGWVPSGAGNESIEDGGVEAGYYRLWGAAMLSNGAIALPAPALSRTCVIRSVVWVESGGSALVDDIAIRVVVGRGSNAAELVVRLWTDGINTFVALFNLISGTQIGSTASFETKVWIELFLIVNDRNDTTFDADCYAREYIRSADPDWDSTYTLVGSGDSIAVVATATDSIAFGHFTANACESHWKTVQIHRTEDTTSNVNLEQVGVNFVDADSVGDRSITGWGESNIDSGFLNVMRASRACTVPNQFLTRGVRATWRGEALTEGQFDHANGYDFGAHLLQLPPALEEWRSNSTGAEIELIWDAGATGVGFRPDAIAVFGRNFPSLTIQFNDTNSWGAPAVSRAFGYYGDGGFSDRYTHIWATDNVDWEYTIYRARVTVFDPDGGAGPWIPHQFRSLATGPKHYVVWNNLGTATEFVYQILDNTEDTLILATSGSANSVGTITETGYLFPYKFAIFSDRFASLIEHAYPATYNPAGPPGPFPNSHVRDYRYCRVVLPAVTHGDADAEFYRCGYIMLGKVLEISAPDAMWGWSHETESGYQVDFASDGVSRARRRHSPRKTLAMDYGYLRPPAEASAAYNSPTDALYDGKRSWLHWVEAARRLENDGLVCALIWEGDRAVGQLEESTAQVTSSPDDLMLARVVQAGSVEHAGWENRSINLANGVTTLPRPACTIKRIVFREEF